MATNTLNGLTADILAAEAVRALTPGLQGLAPLSLDFSAEIAGGGDTVKTRKPGAYTASTYAGSYTSANSTASAITVTLDEPDYVQAEFKPKEVASIGLATLQRTFFPEMANAVVKSMLDAAFAEVTSANVTSISPIYQADISTFDRSKVLAARKALTKANVPEDRRVLLLSADAYEALGSDDKISLALNIGTPDVMRSGAIGRLAGFQVIETNLLGSDEFSTGKTLHGIASDNRAFVIASRAPAVQAATYADIALATEPTSGFTFAVMSWFNVDEGLHKLRVEWLKGVSICDQARIAPITADTV